ncbi:winged helix-turn-helix transcriptional regulator [Iocasia frigidifontis]|uniref:Winged helix-turn-helix transcriptional regulator n=2 Tax=Iocasia fonsfrigidae TaxID=2682810 RepID=A0A8A7KCE0_9FIRM|nr:winged helix-turn-helix transcriptional regulator [Iocasia fonsfrigidae]
MQLVRRINMSKKMKSFDKIDFKIIKELSKDARISASEIARTIDINERTVRRRINNLVESKAIRITTIVDPSMFGYHSIADINLKVDEEIYDEFIKSCKKNPNVCYIASGWGKANLAIETRFLDNEEMYNFINYKLPETKGVEVINFFIVPKIIYNIDEWTPVESDFKD